jgi:hypothetical protein
MVVIMLNYWLLGPARRIEHYKRLFDGWDRKKHWRWRLYLIAILAVTIGIYLFTVGYTEPIAR